MSSFFNISLDHSSPLFNYYPFGDPFTSPDLLAGWAPWSDDNGPFIYNGAGSDSPIMLPGHSTQRTSLDGAIVELYFEGSFLSLYGDAVDCQYDIWLDGKSPASSPSNGTLGEFSDLALGSHRILLTAHPNHSNGSLAFRGAVFGVHTSSDPSQHIPANLHFGDNWSTVNSNNFGSFQQTETLGANLTFTIPQGSAAVVYGLKSLYAGHFNVTIDGNTTTHDAKSSFRSRDVFFSTSGIDSSTDHHVTITNVEEGRLLAINEVQLFTVNVVTPVMTDQSGDQRLKLPTGTTIALIVAGVVAFVTLLLITSYCLLRQRLLKKKKSKRRSRPYSTPWSQQDSIAKTKTEYDSVIIIGNPSSSYGTPSDDDEESFYFIDRPSILTAAPSLRMPNFGPKFSTEFFSSVQSHLPSRQSSQRSHRSQNSLNVHESERSSFLNVPGASGSIDGDVSRQGSMNERQRVRFSTPDGPSLFSQMVKPLARWSSSRKSSQKPPSIEDANSPVESIPFSTSTTVLFSHQASEESSDDLHRMESNAPDTHFPPIPSTITSTDTTGFIPLSSSQLPRRQ